MHEMSIAMEVLRTALSAAAEGGAGRITEVEVEAGAMKLIVPEALEMAWSVAAEGTAAEGSTIRVVERAIEARCRQCGRCYEAAVDSFLCPGCGAADVEITAGDDIILRSITCEEP